MNYIAEVDNLTFLVEVIDDHHVRFGERIIEIDLAALGGQPLYSLVIDGESYEAYVYPEENSWQVILRGNSYTVHVEDERDRKLKSARKLGDSQSKEFVLRAPMPGLIVDLPVQNGSRVAQGDILVILESMKMQNELTSPVPGTISNVKIKKGDSVDLKQILLHIQKDLP
jgi:biotin carboxyl carrier protein